MAEIPTSTAPKMRYALEEHPLSLGGHDWVVLHTGLNLTLADEDHFFSRLMKTLPYGVALWSSGIALAHELAERGEDLAGKTVLELGAGVGLPGLVAAFLGAQVTQTDNQEMAMSVCQLNARRNGIEGIEYALVDWIDWRDDACYDYIIGADILYGDALHSFLRHIFKTNLAPGGHVLLTDPLRGPSQSMFTELQNEGWDVDEQMLEIGNDQDQRTIGVFDVTRPTGLSAQSECLEETS